MTSTGSATVVDDGLAGHFGNEMEVNNINLTFTATTDQPPGLSILFGEYGGNINVMVNGSWTADDFAVSTTRPREEPSSLCRGVTVMARVSC